MDQNHVVSGKLNVALVGTPDENMGITVMIVQPLPLVEMAELVNSLAHSVRDLDRRIRDLERSGQEGFPTKCLNSGLGDSLGAARNAFALLGLAEVSVTLASKAGLLPGMYICFSQVIIHVPES
eukprot:s2112_g14.t1